MSCWPPARVLPGRFGRVLPGCIAPVLPGRIGELKSVPMEKLLVHTLERYGYKGRHGLAYIQSFEVGNLKALAKMTQLPLVQLIDGTGAPYDFVAGHDPRTYADMITPAGLEEIATYAQAIGPYKLLIIPRTADGKLGEPTALVVDAHAQGLLLHPWTFRAENYFLPSNLLRGTDPGAHGNLESEILPYLRAGIDGFFTDNADVGFKAREEFLHNH